MKHVLKLMVIGLLVLAVTCCTQDGDDEVNSINGVWENVEVVDDQTNTFRLVFGKDNTGFEINKVELNTGEITSSLTEISWQITNNVIEVTGNSKETYQLIDNNQLVRDSSENVVLNKISNDYSEYYGGE